MKIQDIAEIIFFRLTSLSLALFKFISFLFLSALRITQFIPLVIQLLLCIEVDPISALSANFIHESRSLRRILNKIVHLMNSSNTPFSLNTSTFKKTHHLG